MDNLDEEDHLLMLWDAGICPNCGVEIKNGKRVGSGKKSDGGFCSLNCYGDYHKATLVERHRKRREAVERHRNS